MTELSEPGGAFISDNYISNETSYLQVAAALANRSRPGRAYLGVGPELNFTYIALTRPALAILVDIRKDNQLLHLLYKAMFGRAQSRSHFLALLLGRRWSKEGDPGPQASIEQVMAHASSVQATKEEYQRLHAELLADVARVLGTPLSDAELAKLDAAHVTFHDGGLDLAFRLSKGSTRKYPPLRDLLSSEDPSGKYSSFLSTEHAFRTVKKLHEANRVLPIVGDFAGTRALARVARELTERNLVVGTFYVSNVEQYLLGKRDTWSRWMSNLHALPADAHSLLVRAYLDQGEPHALAMKGHRTTTVLQSLVRVRLQQDDDEGRSLLQLSSEGVILD